MCDAAGPSEERWDRETEVYYSQFPGCEIGGVRGRYTEFGIEKTLLKCSRCLNQLYCSKEHQKSDWKKHKPNCKSPDALKKVAPTNEDSYETLRKEIFIVL